MSLCGYQRLLLRIQCWLCEGGGACVVSLSKTHSNRHFRTVRYNIYKV